MTPSRQLMKKAILLLSPALVALATPSHASVNPPPGLCYLSKLETSTDSSPVKHGIKIEVVCAHQSRPVTGVDRDGSSLSFRDEKGDLLAAGRRWMNRFREQNPNRFFFSTQAFNAIELKAPEGRVLPIHVHSSALPRGNHAELRGSVILYVAGPESTTVETTVEALREGKPIPLPPKDLPPAIPFEVGSSNDAPMISLRGGAAFTDLASAPEGVTTTEFFGRRLLVVSDKSPADAPVQLKVRLAERMELPVQIRMPMD